MKLIIANCTQQNHDFLYRTIESKSVRMQPIPIGGQAVISGELTSEDIDYIISQHAQYGMVRVDEVDRTKPFIGLCYSIDKPIPVERLRIALAHNNSVLVERGRKIRQEAAIAVSDVLEQQTTGLQALEMSIVEQPKDGSEPEINEGVRVSRTEAPTSPKEQPRRRNMRGT